MYFANPRYTRLARSVETSAVVDKDIQASNRSCPRAKKPWVGVDPKVVELFYTEKPGRRGERDHGILRKSISRAVFFFTIKKPTSSPEIGYLMKSRLFSQLKQAVPDRKLDNLVSG